MQVSKGKRFKRKILTCEMETTLPNSAFKSGQVLIRVRAKDGTVTDVEPFQVNINAIKKEV